MSLPPAFLTMLLLLVGLTVAGGLVTRRRDEHDQVRARLLAAAATGVLLLVAAVLAGTTLPALGRLLAAAPGLATTGALLTFGALPWRSRQRDGLRTAGLVPRGGRDVLPRTSTAVAALGVVLVAALIVCGAVAGPDQRSLSIDRTGWSGTAGPFPGWWYGLPLLGGLVLLGAAAALAASRAARMPEVHQDQAADLAWRRRAVGSVLALVAATLLLDLAGVVWAVGGAARSLVRTTELNLFPAEPALEVVAHGAVLWPLLLLAAAVAFCVAMASAVRVGRVRIAVPA